MKGLDRRLRLRHLAYGLAGLALAGGLVAWAGLVNIGASSGHWSVTNVALHWVMRNAVRTYALLEPAPPAGLDEAARVRRAAGHFEAACVFCHGAPERPSPLLAARMTPPPPPLTHVAEHWGARELFRIVRHGVKYTGMPAWIALGREDEVWDMVAFLKALPAMDDAAYRRAALGPQGPEPTADTALAGCVRCHGRDGGSDGGAFPVLAGQSEAYLAASLAAFASGRRASGVMQFAVDGLEEAELARLARYYAGLPGLGEAPPAAETASPATATAAPGTGGGGGPAAGPGAWGLEIIARGLPAEGVPACAGCHGPSSARNPAYPRLGGQDAAYLANQLRLMKAEARGGGPYQRVMQVIAGRLPEQATDADAAAYAGRPAGPAPAARPD
ncbi:c-type cytochrome [Ancylobacter lacus]|uniref:c-type cytochrome n=1 Tax=Ancylobacter lacus TaxID=2579970 RepID=UPI001BD00814|nr:c-type cytochrome [Ancylobacter lacus]MBS7539593.1 c-type cytochrome [Ancylobacter lacus]